MHDARPTIADLSTLVRSPGKNNDLIELTAKQPRLAELTGSVFPRAISTLDRAQPVFEYARSYTPDLAAWVTNFGQLAANYDANGHYARVQPMFLPSSFCERHTHGERAQPEARRLRLGQPHALPRRDHAALPRRFQPGSRRQ